MRLVLPLRSLWPVLLRWSKLPKVYLNFSYRRAIALLAWGWCRLLLFLMLLSRRCPAFDLILVRACWWWPAPKYFLSPAMLLLALNKRCTCLLGQSAWTGAVHGLRLDHARLFLFLALNQSCRRPGGLKSRLMSRSCRWLRTRSSNIFRLLFTIVGFIPLQQVSLYARFSLHRCWLHLCSSRCFCQLDLTISNNRCLNSWAGTARKPFLTLGLYQQLFGNNHCFHLLLCLLHEGQISLRPLSLLHCLLFMLLLG